MLNSYWKTLVFALSCLCAFSSHGTDVSDYDCSFALSDGSQSIRSVTLTEKVYGCIKFSSYADLAVVNAAKQLVPFTINSPSVSVDRKNYHRDIAFFQEPEESSYRTGDQIRRIAALTGVVSHESNGQQWQNTNVHYSAVILQQPPQGSDQYDDQLQALTLSIDSGDRPIRATVLVELSDDLQNWRTLSKPHDLYFLPGKVKELNSNSLIINRYVDRNAKYFRLATLSNVQNFTDRLRNISGSYLRTEKTSQAMQWLTVAPYKVEGEEGVWQFDLSGLAPISALRFSNADNIVFYQGQVSSQIHSNPSKADDGKRKSGRKKLKAVIKNAVKGRSRHDKFVPNWRSVTNFNRYRLMLENGSVESPDIAVSNIKSRTWRIKFNVPANLSTMQLPKIELGWKASQINFIAQGKGPFVLLAGSDKKTKKVAFPSSLQGLSTSAEKVELLGALQPTELNTSPPIKADEAAKTNWGEILLWVILLFGVGLMLYMAYHLTRKMNE